MSFAENLRRLRMRVNPSAKAFAEEIGIGYTKYISYETGVWPNEKTLIAIADALQVSLDTLLGRSLKAYDECKQIIHGITTEDGQPFKVIEGLPSKRVTPVTVQIYDEEAEGKYSNICFSSKNEFVKFMKRITEIHERTSHVLLEQLIWDALQNRLEQEAAKE